MKTLCGRWIPFLFVFFTFLWVSPNAAAGPYTYGISDDNKIHQVDLTAFIDSVVFNTNLAGLTNGVAWDEAGGRLLYRNPENGSLYFWTRTTNTQQVMYGEVLPGFNANADVYNGAYWYVADGTDTLVRARLDFSTPNIPVVAEVESFANFDGSGLTSFLFGDITIDKSGILYGSSNYGLFSVNISGPQPTQFKILSAGFGVRQITIDPTQSFLYSHDYATGKWYKSDLNGVESSLNSAPNVQFSSAGLRDIGDVISASKIPSPVPEPAAWQLLLAGAVCIAFAGLRPKGR
jgi:hypothetical protein